MITINIKLLKQKDFFLLIMGNLISLVGNQLQSFALSLYVLKITGSATKFALVMAIMLIPKLILAPIAGVFVDWIDRKKLIVYLDMFNGIMVGIFAVLYNINNKLSLPQIYILIILLSFTSVFFDPAVNTVIPSIIKDSDIVDANAIFSIIMSTGAFVSPILAGFLFGSYGLFLILILNSLSFIVASIGERFINIPQLEKTHKKISFKYFNNEFLEGIGFIKTKKLLVNIILLTIVINLLINPIFSIGIAYISKNILKISDFQYGIFQSIIMGSMIISPLICSKVSKKVSLSKILFLDIMVVSLLIGIMSLILSTFYLSLFNTNIVPLISFIIISFLVGVCINIGNMSINCMFQKIVPLSMMGRIGTVRSTAAMACVPLGQMIFGILYDNISIWVCLAITSISVFIIILMFKKSLYKSEYLDNNLNI